MRIIHKRFTGLWWLPILLLASVVLTAAGVPGLIGSQRGSPDTADAGAYGAAGKRPTGAVDADKLAVVATTSQIGDVVRNLAGDMIELEILMGEGVDPHLYLPTRSDIRRLTQADLVFHNGLHLEAYLVEMLEYVGQRKPVIELAQVIGKQELMDDPATSRYDPHIWMDVRLWMQAARKIAFELTQLDPRRERSYLGNLAAYLFQLEELDRYAEQTILSVPERSRVLVTAHDAFSYMGRRYGLEVVGIQGISTSSEASVHRIEQTVELLITRGITSVFVETSVSDRALRALIEGAAARRHQVELGARVYSDAMGPAGSYQGTYIGMIDHNITSIALALGGSPPAGGFRVHLERTLH